MLAQRGVKVMQSRHKIVFTCDFHRTSLFGVPPFSELVCEIQQFGNGSALMGITGGRQNNMNTKKGVKSETVWLLKEEITQCLSCK